MKSLSFFLVITTIFVAFSCNEIEHDTSLDQIENVIDFSSSPDSPDYRESLVFSDQGAWFGYGLNIENGGFAGPFIMTQENGTWISPDFNKLTVFNSDSTKVDFQVISSDCYLSHMEQNLLADGLRLSSKLVFVDSQTAMLSYEILNTSNEKKEIGYQIKGYLYNPSMKMNIDRDRIYITSELNNTMGILKFQSMNLDNKNITDSVYCLTSEMIQLNPGEELSVKVLNSFVNSNDSSDCYSLSSAKADSVYVARLSEKTSWLLTVNGSLRNEIIDKGKSDILVNKCLMTLQNNWRSASGDLKYDGLFPSYHYYWFHGFWAWDSWKHAYALAPFNPELAKDQILAMYEFMDDDGFIADCIYRDTLIENHNYRNTKPPLSAWAIKNVNQYHSDREFLEKIYPYIIKQHYWWYKFRDHDRDGICEYGSTDGSLVAAKWESGMDNAVRFDSCRILYNSPGAYSLDQESVDLNSYLYAEKLILAEMSNMLGEVVNKENFLKEAAVLRELINSQFFDDQTGWYYDTSLDGESFIKDMGCEGWIPLWANVADQEKAKMVRDNILDTSKFNKKIPLQTLAGDNKGFKPDRGYWRGPVWIDQAYFGIVGLRNYGFQQDADKLTRKILLNSEGLVVPGPSIRENYNPLTGEGMEAQNFSWSAAHYLLLIMK